MTTAVRSAVTAYAEAVLHGGDVVGRLVRLACERHLRDLETGHERGLHFDEDAADKAIGFFRILRLPDGHGAGNRFELLAWQEFVVGSIFGWLGPDGRRRFHYAYVEVARGNGKSPLAAGIGLYGLTADGEVGAQVYSAATTRDQAKVVFNDAVNMATRSPSLWPKLTKTVNNLAFMRLGSYFRPLAADSSKMDGLRVHVALVDELHEHPNGDVLAKLRTGMKSTQPLLFEITTAGYDRHSVCYEEHDYAIKVLEGVLDDDSLFAYIAAIDSAYTEVLHIDEALGYMVKWCSCQSRDGESIREVVPTILIDQLLTKASAKFATSGISETQTPSTKRASRQSTGSGRWNTLIEDERFRPNFENATESESIQSLASGTRGRPESSPTQSKPSRPSSESREDSAPSADSLRGAWSQITTMTRERFGGSSAASAIADWVCSEILQKAYSEHSITCNVKSSSLVGPALSVHIPDDDWTDEACWPKANPSLDVAAVRTETLREECAKAIQIPGQQNSFKRLRLNVWTEQATRWLDMDVWDENAGPLDHEAMREALKGRECYAGGDLSNKIDLTCIALWFPAADGSVDVLTFPFCPEDNIQKRAERDRVPYNVWVEQGYLTATPGNVIDYDYIRKFLNDIADDYVIKEVGLDPWNATQLMIKLNEDGFTCMPIRQGFQTLTEPTKEIERLIVSRKLRHGGHPVLRWAASNVAVSTDPAGNVKPDKAKSTERIDPMAALVNAGVRAIAHEETHTWSGIYIPGGDDDGS